MSADASVDVAQGAPQVTDAAYVRLAEIIAADGRTDAHLRVSVLGGGCSGFQYKFELDTERAEDDLVLSKDDVAVVIDSVSAPFLSGAVIDFKRELIGERFAIDNPNAASTCGCGTSFSI
ncbi:MAG: iron-sulfur cluster insertion protein ErpA [Neomegalonema sp.]|nr:iron-sulfur cluster insertion protein ErpA [Neomegalonema sp.]